MPTKKRKRTKRTTVEQIVDATKLCLAESAGADVSLRRVAERADLSMGTVCYHFPSKDTLFYACLEDYDKRLAGTFGSIRRDLAVDEPPSSLVEGMARSIYRFYAVERQALALETALGRTSDARPRALQETVAETAMMLARLLHLALSEAVLLLQSIIYLSESYVLSSDADLSVVMSTVGSRADVEDHIVDCTLRLALAPNGLPR